MCRRTRSEGASLGGEYENEAHHKRGTSFAVPDVVGVEMKLAVDRLLDGDEDWTRAVPKTSGRRPENPWTEGRTRVRHSVSCWVSPIFRPISPAWC